MQLILHLINKLSEFDKEKDNKYTANHKEYNTNVILFFMYFVILRTCFMVLRSNMGIRFSGESSGITMMNKVFHLFLVLVRIGLTAVCISLAFNEGWWVLENTVAKMFIKN